MIYRVRRLALIVGAILAFAMPVRAVNYSWTNTTAGATGFWTNGVLWGQAGITPYPSFSTSDAAFLTNQFSGTATTILDSKLAGTVSTLAISNALGEAWLIVTNNAAGTSIAMTNTTLVLGNGSRLQIDSGATVRNTTLFTWFGTNGTIYLNKGGSLFTGGLTIDSGSMTGLVTSASGPGNGGVMNFNGGNLIVGSTASGDNNSFRVTNGAILSNFASLIVGRLAGSDFNSVIVTNGGRVIMVNGGLFVGAGGSQTVGGSGNAVIISNSLLNSGTGGGAGAPITVGFGSSNNTLTLLAGTIVDNNNQGINVGGNVNGASPYTAFSAGNLMTVNGALITNAGTVTIGYATGGIPTAFVGISNRLEVVNGGVLSNVSQLFVGGRFSGSDFNSLIVTGSGSGFFMTSAGNILVGSTAGSGNNSVLLSNSVLWGTVATIGSSSTNNTLTLLDNSVWNNSGGALTIGGGAGISNVVTVSGAQLTNFGLVTLGISAGASGNQLLINNGGILSNVAGFTIGGVSGSNSNSLIVTNSGRLFQTSGGLVIGSPAAGQGAGGNGNTAILSNSVINIGSAGVVVGNASSNNTLTLLANTVINNSNRFLTVGGGSIAGGGTTYRADFNTMTVDGAIVTNLGELAVGGGRGQVGSIIAAVSNRLDVINGGVLSNVAGLLIVGGGVTASGAGSSYNSLIVTSRNGGLFMTGGGLINVGIGGSFNTVILSNSALWGNAASTIGSASSNNTLTLLAGTAWNGGGFGLTVGSGAAAGNTLTMDGAVVTNINALTVGNASANNNSVLLKNGALLEANALTIGAATTGNTISNVGSAYQFTNAPAITSVTPGDIAITAGTISFRATGLANVATNAANQINKIRFAGANTFMLNNASNTAAAVSQTYTFNAVAGNPSNYVNLVMVNGATAYRNANGANITIGSTGTFLASNTVATIAGTFTNNGVADIVNATVDFQSALHVAGTLTLRSGFVTGAGARTIAGTLRGNGSVVGDTTVSGNLAPGFSVGTLVFSNNLTLAGTYNAELDGSTGSADQLIVIGALTLTGSTLNLSELVAADDAAYIIATYGSLVGTFNTVSGLPSGYLVNYSYGGNQIAVVLVPEPGTVGLVGLGLVALFVVSRWRRQ